MARSEPDTPEARARKRAKSRTDLLWHIGTYVVVNAFLWFIDIIGGGGYWAYWTTIFWGIGIAFHILAYNLEEHQRRKYRQYLDEEQ